MIGLPRARFCERSRPERSSHKFGVSVRYAAWRPAWQHESRWYAIDLDNGSPAVGSVAPNACSPPGGGKTQAANSSGSNRIRPNTAMPSSAPKNVSSNAV